MTEITRGSCNCGGVKWEATGELRDVLACHCGQCRKQTGLYYVATNVHDDSLTLVSDATLKWYRSSDFARRGFCGECGSALFWKHDEENSTSLIVGAIDGSTRLSISDHIFVRDKGDFYTIDDGKPTHDQAR